MAHNSCLIDISHCLNEWESSTVSDPIALAIPHSPAVPGSLHRKQFHHHTTGLYQSSPPPSVIPKYSRPFMQGTSHEVGNYCRGNGRYYGSSISRGKQRSHLKIPTSLAYIEEPRTNDNYLSLSRKTCLEASIWGIMVVVVNIYLTRATVLKNFLGIPSCWVKNY